MQISDLPDFFPIPFAASAGGSYIRPIPEASQIGITDGAASLHDGFPPLCFLAVGAGGVPPFGQDFNGLFNLISAWSQWAGMGNPVPYNSAFQSAIGGYAIGSRVMSLTVPGLLWKSTVDNNTTNPDAAGGGWVAERIRLAGATTFYVSTTGNDSTGLGTSLAPWATMQHAANVIQQTYDVNGIVPVVQLADGTYTGGARLVGPLVGATARVPIIFSGNSGAPGNVIISTTGALCFQTESDGALQFQYMKVQSSGGATDSVEAGLGGLIVKGPGVIYGAAGRYQNFASSTGIITTDGSDYTISGGAQCHGFADSNGVIEMNAGATITLTGTPVFSTAFVLAQEGAFIDWNGNTFSGAATGPRYSAFLNGVIFTNGGGASFFPGNSAGSTTTGGQYA